MSLFTQKVSLFTQNISNYVPSATATPQSGVNNTLSILPANQRIFLSYKLSKTDTCRWSLTTGHHFPLLASLSHSCQWHGGSGFHWRGSFYFIQLSHRQQLVSYSRPLLYHSATVVGTSRFHNPNKPYPGASTICGAENAKPLSQEVCLTLTNLLGDTTITLQDFRGTEQFSKNYIITSPTTLLLPTFSPDRCLLTVQDHALPAVHNMIFVLGTQQ